jgi:hypothetical protein
VCGENWLCAIAEFHGKPAILRHRHPCSAWPGAEPIT